MINAWSRELDKSKQNYELCRAELKREYASRKATRELLEESEAKCERLSDANETLYRRWLSVASRLDEKEKELKEKENELIGWVDAYSLEISNVETMLAVLHHEYSAKGPRWVMNALQVAHNGSRGK